MASDLLYRSAVELRELVLSKEVSPVELLDHSLARLDEVEPKLNSFVTVTEDVARAAARSAEKAVMDGDPPGLLHGLPLSVKDLIAMDGVRWTFGSKSTADNVAALDAPAVERVRKAGAVILGKTTTSEFGCKAVGDSPLTGITRNPWNLSKTPGGSSAGAASSVAAGVTPFALGTDGGGSLRIPGSLTGLFAVKPQFARVPIFPESAAPTLSHVGPMTRTVRDAALLLTAIAGFDRRYKDVRLVAHVQAPFRLSEAMARLGTDDLREFLDRYRAVFAAAVSEAQRSSRRAGARAPQASSQSIASA